MTSFRLIAILACRPRPPIHRGIVERVPQGQFENTFPRTYSSIEGNANFSIRDELTPSNWDASRGGRTMGRRIRIGGYGYSSSFSIGSWCPRSFLARHINHLSFIFRVISPADVALVCTKPPPLPSSTLPRGIRPKTGPFSLTRSKSCGQIYGRVSLRREENGRKKVFENPYTGVPSTVRRSLANYRYRSRVKH